MQKIEMFRLIADDGKIVTNGKIFAKAIDCFADKVDEWNEVDASEDKTEDEE